MDILDSPFYHSDAEVEVIMPAVIFSHKAAEVEISASSRLSSETASYSRYQEVALTCRFYDLSRSASVPVLETQECAWRSGQMSIVRLNLAAQSVKAGTYHFQIALESSV